MKFTKQLKLSKNSKKKIKLDIFMYSKTSFQFGREVEDSRTLFVFLYIMFVQKLHTKHLNHSF